MAYYFSFFLKMDVFGLVFCFFSASNNYLCTAIEQHIISL